MSVILDPFVWDKWLAVVVCIAIVGLYLWKRKRIRKNVEESIDIFPTSISNLKLTYWFEEGLRPQAQELAAANRAFTAARTAWPTLVNRLSTAEFNIWFVRDPEQRVGWRQYRAIRWKDIPAIAGIPAVDPESGYGGMAEHTARTGTCYVATFMPTRPLEKLLAHEATHAITRISSSTIGEHPVSFMEAEKLLLEELEKTG